MNDSYIQSEISPHDRIFSPWALSGASMTNIKYAPWIQTSLAWSSFHQLLEWPLLSEFDQKSMGVLITIGQGGRQSCLRAVLLLVVGNTHLLLDGLCPHLHVAPGPNLLGRHPGLKMPQ